MDCKEIIKKYLKENGYDGLWVPGEECSCDIDDLVVCNEDFSDCIPGYFYKCKGCDLSDKCEWFNNEYKGCISKDKNNKGSMK